MNFKHNIGVIFIDLEKAFDSNGTERLIYKTLKPNFPTSLITI